jgi:hypothetical protein
MASRIQVPVKLLDEKSLTIDGDINWVAQLQNQPNDKLTPRKKYLWLLSYLLPGYKLTPFLYS